MQTYEVEVKALLGSAQKAQEVREALRAIDPSCELVAQNRQLNHYFESEREDALAALSEKVAPHIDVATRARLDDLAARSQSFSVRTRDKDNIVLLVVKASVGDDTSENGVARMEFEAPVPLTLLELDQLVLEAGFRYQAKWSREREEYRCSGINVCIDKNAGYGYVAEFERVTDDATAFATARAEIDALMRAVGVEELPQDRLERMFSHYNSNWQKYYGTDRIFVIQ